MAIGHGETLDDGRGSRPATAPRVGAMLVVALECDRPTAGASRHFLEGVDVVDIGRGERRSVTRVAGRVPSLDVRLPGLAVSRSHARLVRVGAQWAVEDAESRNGTYVNGARVARALLQPGDLVEVGRTLLYVEASATLPADAPPDLDAEGDDVGNVTLHPELAAQLDAADRIAAAAVPVLILGETGSGKEVLARRVHARSRRSGRFVAVNCGALPGQLVEAALFGHVRGAFSGAIRDEVGFVRAAHGGTLFLDEIGELPRESQAALLRVLQEREVTPVGATVPQAVDLRIVAATNVAMRDAVARGDVRPDLFARLSGFTLELPPLRARPRDIGSLAAAILQRATPRPDAARVTPEAGALLLRHSWPHNVRELEQALTTALALAAGGAIDAPHLPALLQRAAPPAAADPPARGSAKEDALRLELMALLKEHRGSVTHVARAMGKARTQVHRWLRRFGIDPDAYRD